MPIVSLVYIYGKVKIYIGAYELCAGGFCYTFHILLHVIAYIVTIYLAFYMKVFGH